MHAFRETAAALTHVCLNMLVSHWTAVVLVLHCRQQLLGSISSSKSWNQGWHDLPQARATFGSQTWNRTSQPQRNMHGQAVMRSAGARHGKSRRWPRCRMMNTAGRMHWMTSPQQHLPSHPCLGCSIQKCAECTSFHCAHLGTCVCLHTLHCACTRRRGCVESGPGT